MIDLRRGDLFDILPTVAADSVDAVITDPPYGIGFMGKEWDTFRPGAEASRIVPNKHAESDNPNLRGRTRAPASSPSAVEYDYTTRGLREFQTWSERWAREAFRVMKPGAYLVVFAAPRSYHRMACGPRTAGEATDRADGSKGLNSPRAGAGRTGGARNTHPTVKPVDLMRWLVRLFAPPGGLVLDPFNGSGTTGMACVHEGRRYLGLDREAAYIEIARRRIASVAPLLTAIHVSEVEPAEEVEDPIRDGWVGKDGRP